MQEGKVIIANGSPETRARLDNFKSKMKLGDPLKKITMGGAIDFAIAQAERVPELEKENLELKEKIGELEEDEGYANGYEDGVKEGYKISKHELEELKGE